MLDNQGMKPLHRILASAAFLTAVAIPIPAAAELAPEWFGTWHLDVAKSTYIGKAPWSRGTWKVSRATDGDVVMVYDQVGTRGGVTHMEWKGSFDGSDHRIHGPDAVVTYAYKEIDPRTLDLVVKVDGRATANARVVLSSDGTVTATTQNGTARGTMTTITVYRK